MGCHPIHPQHRPGVHTLSRTVQLRLCLAATLSLVFASTAHAQGCAQCRDNVQATPLPVQLAYRHAIELLAISGLSVFAGGVFLLRRYR